MGSSHRQCFYCKQSFPSAAFHTHLKQCPQRQKKNNPGPLQSNPYRPQPMNNNMMPMMNNNNNQELSLWVCPMCSYQNAPNAAICTMCKQGQKQQVVQQQNNANNFMQFNNNHNNNNNGYRPPQPPPPKKHENKQDTYWECQSCTFVNSKMSASCKICSQPQPKSNSNAMPPPPQKKVFGKSHPPPPHQQQQQKQQIPPDLDQPMMNNNNNQALSL